MQIFPAFEGKIRKVFLPKYGFCQEVFDYDPTPYITINNYDMQEEEELIIHLSDPYRRSSSSLSLSSAGDVIKGIICQIDNGDMNLNKT